MNITTKNKIKPVAQRKAKGNKLTDSELQLLRGAATEVQDSEFKDLLQTICNETTPRLRRHTGKKLLNKIRFATGARRENDLPLDNPRPEKVKRILKLPMLFFGGLCVIILSGCATATTYKAAGADGGYSETLYAPDRFRVHFDGNENTSVECSRDFALLRAADITIQHGYRYFTVSDATPPPANFSPPSTSGPNVQVNNYNYGNTYNYRNQGMQWNNDNGMASQNANAGLSNFGNFLAEQQAAKQQLRQSAQTELLVQCFIEKPLGIEPFDADFISKSIRQKYVIKEAAPLAETHQQMGSQNNPMSGRYVGNGKAVNNGIGQPYQIALDVFDSGEITFICTGTVNNQQVVITGKGTVDSNGNVVVQNELGDTGHGTISGKILKAGGQNTDGSVSSYFTATKQE